MKTIKNTMIKILPVVIVLFWTGCEDLDFPDPNNPTSDTATIQSLVTGAEAQLRSGFGVWIRDLLVVGREAYYLEPADPRYTGELLHGPVDPGGFLCYTPWAANYKVMKNCQTLLSSADADAGAKGFAQTLNAYCLMRVLEMTDENGARLNYDGDINLAVASKCYAFLKHRGYVIPEDVRSVVYDILRHRVGLTYEAEAENISSEDIISDIINEVEVP